MNKISHYEEIKSYATKDGSEIRELMHPDIHNNRMQSLAEASVPPGARTRLHKHLKSEEIYHITQGSGLLTLDNETLPVKCGDTICIAPQTPHCIENTGDSQLKILCSCAPPYAHDDTILLDE